ncbi:hypothetical protein SJAV_09660 [Sulfurisphaera javensis]|uniref:Uncharacterized protein n=1 Tax=Sulfurisphaera javensis TaxID=2049879 RepID=A0AAT9GQA0_9CREN
MIGRIISSIGGLITLIASITSIATKEPLIDHFIKIIAIYGNSVIALGIIGLIGALVTFYGVYKNDWRVMIGGGIAGLFAPCVFSILSIIGGVIEINRQKVASK